MAAVVVPISEGKDANNTAAATTASHTATTSTTTKTTAAATYTTTRSTGNDIEIATSAIIFNLALAYHRKDMKLRRQLEEEVQKQQKGETQMQKKEGRRRSTH